MAERAARWLVARLGLLLVLGGWGYVTPPLLGGPLVHRLYSRTCAQATGHAFLWRGEPLALCARCVGLFGGFAVVGLLALGVSGGGVGLLAAAAGWLPLTLDATTQLLGFRESSNPLRLGTGLLAGAALAFLLVPRARRLGVEVSRGPD